MREGGEGCRAEPGGVGAHARRGRPLAPRLVEHEGGNWGGGVSSPAKRNREEQRTGKRKWNGVTCANAGKENEITLQTCLDAITDQQEHGCMCRSASTKRWKLIGWKTFYDCVMNWASMERTNAC